MKGIDSKEKILDRFFLKFHNIKYEEEYSKKNLNTTKERNIQISIFNLAFSCILLLFFTCLVVEVKNIYSNLKIKLSKSSEKSTNRNIKRYYSSYVVVNETAESYDDNNLFMTEDYSYTVRQYLFAERCLPLIVTCFIIYTLILICSLFFKKDSVHKLIAFLNYGMFGMNFHIISGILRSFFQLTSDPIFFIVAIQLFFRIAIILKSRMNWFGVLIVSGGIVILQWSLFLSLHYKLHLTIVYYFSVDTLIQMSSILLAYYHESNSKYEFFLLRKMNFDKEYLVNFLYHMTQGFFSYNQGNIIFVNEYMKRIVNNYELAISLKTGINTNFFFFRPSINCDLGSSLSEDDTLFLNSHYRPSKENYLNKQIIEGLFEELFEINIELQEEIIEIFTDDKIKFRKENKKSISVLDNLFTTMKKTDQFRKFTCLGKLNLGNKNNFNFDISNEILNKQYEIYARLIKHEDNDEYLEFIFSDFTNVIKIEREKTISSCRSMYLSKIAHEFKNPITSLIELSTRIKEESEFAEMKKLSIMSDYSINICRIMNRFLNDFSIFTNLKIPCRNCYKFKECEACDTKFYCINCNICLNCEKLQETNFDYTKIIDEFIQSFSILNNYEGKNHFFKFESDLKNRNLISIYTNKDIFYSIIYNILFHCYKSANSSEIKIKVDDTDKEFIRFEISDTGLEINKYFIEKLNTMKFKFEDNVVDHNLEDLQCERFNKYFKLYIAFCLVKKIGFHLSIDSDKFGNKYSFFVKSHHLLNSPFTNSISIHFFDKVSENCDNISKFSNQSNDEFFNNNTKIYEHPINFNYSKYKSTEEEEEITASRSPNITGMVTIQNHFSHYQCNSFTNNNINQICITSINKTLKSKDRKFSESSIIRFLIVDDEFLVRNTLKRFLKKLSESKLIKYEIVFEEADNCLKALEIIYENFQNNRFFNYAFVDESMPFMKGSTLIKLMKNIHEENDFYKITFISHTSFDTIEKKKFITEQGADYILNKPVSYDKFSDFLDILINKNYLK